MELSIIYEEPGFIVIDKPSGIAVHKTSPTDPQTTVVDLLRERYPHIGTVGEDPIRPGIVHRLDKETSGLMIVAKTNEAFFYFKNLFQQRDVRKTYLALVHGHPNPPRGTIDAPLGKIGAKQTAAIKGKKTLVERDAVTDYRTLQSFTNYALLEVSPRTGRTHQIRVHLKSIGNPIAGDALYAPKSLARPDGLGRLFLHAQRLEFTAPDGKSLVLEADLPEDLQKVLSALE